MNNNSDFQFLRTSITRCKTGKPCFDKKSAITAKNKREKESHQKLRVYQCPDCGGWHLTSQVKEEKHHKPIVKKSKERLNRAKLFAYFEGTVDN